MIGRRRLLAAAFGTLAALPGPGVGGGRRRVTQGELDDAIALHRLWLGNKNLGRRAGFAFCNLSGLDFGYSVHNQVLLRNADFTSAYLNGIGGNDVNFHYASLQYADLAGSQSESASLQQRHYERHQL